MESETTPKPKYKPGDWVKVNDPGDICHGREMQIEGLSPSTLKKRTKYKGVLTWRYSLWGSDGYYNESELVPMEV